MRREVKIALGIFAAALLSLIALSLGQVRIAPMEAVDLGFSFLKQGYTETIPGDVIAYIRLPHFALSFIIGSGLAVCGAVMQAVMKNPLADPYLLGVSSGASLGAVVGIAIGAGRLLGVHAVGICAFFGAILVSVLLLLFSYITGRGNSLSLLLFGFALNALCGGAVNLIIMGMHNTGKTRSVQFWLMGNIMADDWKTTGLLFAVVLAGILFFFTQRRLLDLMLMGDELSLTMGRNLASARKWYILATSFLVGAMVYVSGIIGFIGLIIPHMARLVAGAGHRQMLPLAALGGGAFLSLAEAAGRVMIPGAELPIGVTAAVCGLPFFLWMISHPERRRA